MILQASALTYFRDERAIFRNVDFSLSAGQVLHVQGGNGAGKTTLLRVLCGLLPHETGEIMWRGRPLRDAREDYLSDLIYLGHASGIKDILSPRENIHAAMHMAGSAVDEQAVVAALRVVGLAGYEDVPAFQLSAGQRRRVALARLWAQKATLWILDEPFSALDREGIGMLERQLCLHVETGGCVVVTTHQHDALPIGNVIPLTLSRSA